MNNLGKATVLSTMWIMMCLTVMYSMSITKNDGSLLILIAPAVVSVNMCKAGNKQ